MKFKTILVSLILTPVAALAANPPQCIPPSLLQLEAKSGLFDYHKVTSCNEVKLNTWMISDIPNGTSPTRAAFKIQLEALKKYSDWKVGSNGGIDPHGYAITCSYYSPSHTSPYNNVLIQKIFSRKICSTK